MIEFLITIAFMIVLLSVALPSAGSLRDADRAGDILKMTEKLAEASAAYRRDTGKSAIEFSPARGGHSYTQPRYHLLSMKQADPKWRGPYLDRPLSLDDNPYGGAIYLQNNLTASPANGFDLHGSGNAEQHGPGQFVVFYGVPERIARSVDEKLDGGLAERGAGWRHTGKVEWSPASGGALCVYLMAAGN